MRSTGQCPFLSRHTPMAEGNLQILDTAPALGLALVKHGTAIGWTHWPDTKGVTLVAVTGCTPISAACGQPLGPGHCYAAVQSSSHGPAGLARHPKYAGVAVDGQFTGVIRTHPQVYDEADRWRTRRTVFETSMGDWLHERVPDEFVALGMAVTAGTPRHNWLKLSKRDGRLAKLIPSPRFRDLVLREYRRRYGPNVPLFDWPLPNLALGLTVENQEYAGKRMPRLVEVAEHAACVFVSGEPLLDEVDLTPWFAQFPAGRLWVIGGGQSGKDHQPVNLDHLRRLRDDCARHDVPFFLKQLGGPRPTSGGKKLDGREHLAFPAMAYRDVSSYPA
jgi:protein gp37